MRSKNLVAGLVCALVLVASVGMQPVFAQDSNADQEETGLARTWGKAEDFLWGFIGNTVEPFRMKQLENAENEESRMRDKIDNEKPAKDAPSLDKVVHLLRIIWRAILFFLVLVLASKTLFLVVSVIIVFLVVRKIVRWIRYQIRGYE
jgi:hypothetical protein